MTADLNFALTQSAEVERLNGVYNKLLKTAGVDLIGRTAAHMCFLLLMSILSSLCAISGSGSNRSASDGQISVTEGRGKLLDAHTVEVTTPAGEKRILKTKYILLAVGGKPVKAPIPGSVSRFPSADVKFCHCHGVLYPALSLHHSMRR